MSVLDTFPKISPFLWFDKNAEEAVAFYVAVFPNSKRLGEMRPDPKGPPLTITFELDGQKLTAINGGPKYRFTPAISFVVRCADQAEIDDYWTKLTADGGEESRCGWLTDKYGLSWQVVPADLPNLLKTPQAIQAMMGMKKLVVAELASASTR